MNLLNQILREQNELCWYIEKLPPSEEQTLLSEKASIIAHKLQDVLIKLEDLNQPNYWTPERIKEFEEKHKKL